MARPAFTIKFSKTGDDQFGGLPPGVDGDSWPICADCEHPMDFIALLAAHKERLPLKDHAAIALFSCNGKFSDATCKSGVPFGGCNTAMFLDKKTAAAGVSEDVPPKGSPRSMKERRIDYTRKLEADPEGGSGKRALIVSKLGGYPVWLQEPEVPFCAECDETMRFAAQLRSALDPDLRFGENGVGYLFVCPNEDAAAFLWQNK